MSWLCSCGLVNSGLNQNCAARLTWNDILHEQVSENSLDWLRIRIAVIEHGKEVSIVTPQEELYAEFFQKGKLLVKDMDITQMRETREKLSRISLEAKATLAAVDDELRERRAKAGPKSKEWTITPTGPDDVTSDAINAVKVRKDRMSKLDKVKAQLLGAGIDEETVKEMVANLERKATEKNLKTVSFGSKKIEVPTPKPVVTVKPIEPTDNGDKPEPPKKVNPFAAKVFKSKDSKQVATEPEE